MNTLVLLADVGGGGQIEQIARTFGVDWPQLIAQIISFGIVCALLNRFAYRPVLTILEQRRQQIAEAQADAEKIKSDLAQTESRRQEIMMQASAQATRLIEEARSAAARAGDQETQKAMAAAEKILAEAREAATRVHERMLAQLKREIGRLVVETTEAVTGRILTSEDQERLGEETAKQLAV